ncbi:hypothetical protein RCJ22_02335, partial [Vibrio sp. FNV 38]|nr:hypothetical protein [Vibrio sp. FNV 38]
FNALPDGRFARQVIVHAANGLNVFCHVYSLSEYKNEPSTLPSMFREPCGFNHTREARRFPSRYYFSTC